MITWLRLLKIYCVIQICKRLTMFRPRIDSVEMRAIESLCGIRDARAVKLLINLLELKSENQDSSIIKYNIAIALGKIGDARAVEALTKLLDSGSFDAVEALGEARAVEPLINTLLRYSDRSLSTRAAKALGKTGDARAVEPLMRVLGSTNDYNFFRIINETQWNFSDTRPVEFLIGALQNPREDIRTAAVGLLGKISDVGKISDARAVELLIKLLCSKEDNIRSVIADALGILGDARAVEPLINALGRTQEDIRTHRILTDSAYRKVRYSAARALGKIGDARAVEPLIAALDYYEVNYAAAEALGKIGDARAVEALTKELGTHDNYFRSIVATALHRLGKADLARPIRGDDSDIRRLCECGDASMLEALYSWLVREQGVANRRISDVDRRLHDVVKMRAVPLLIQCGDTRVIKLLVEYLEDGDFEIRMGAAKTILSIASRPEFRVALSPIWNKVASMIKEPHKVEIYKTNRAVSDSPDTVVGKGIGLAIPEDLDRFYRL